MTTNEDPILYAGAVSRTSSDNDRAGTNMTEITQRIYKYKQTIKYINVAIYISLCIMFIYALIHYDYIVLANMVP